MKKLFENMPRPTTNMIMTIAAVVISLCALVVSFAEVRIMRTQQRASLYPYLILSQHYDDEGFGLTVSNKGIGPAKINSFQVRDDDHYFTDWVSLARYYLPDSLKSSMSYSNMKMSNIQQSIIAPGEEVRLVFTRWTPISRQLLDPIQQLNLQLCYSSLLDEHWMINDLEPPESINQPCKNDDEKELY